MQKRLKHKTATAHIVQFAHTQDLVDLILKLKLPNEKQPAVKNNRDFRVFATSEFDAIKKVKEYGIPVSKLAGVYKLNP